ncbi:MAG: GNAT family N-acetyltransferase [Pseudomonadota bacterium]
MIEIRQMRSDEADVLGGVMWRAIRDGPSQYTEAQRAAWLRKVPRGQTWAERLDQSSVWVADVQDTAVGFLTLQAGGYIDLAFVDPAAQGRGVFSALYAAAECAARARGLDHLLTHASLMAQPAFAARGFHVIAHETVQRAGLMLARAEMKKVLT